MSVKGLLTRVLQFRKIISSKNSFQGDNQRNSDTSRTKFKRKEAENTRKMSYLKKVLSRRLSATPPSHEKQERIARPCISARVGEGRLWFAGVCVGVGVVYDCSARAGEQRAFGKDTCYKTRT